MAALLSARVSAPAALRSVAKRTVRCAAVTSASAGKTYMESLPGVSAPMGFFDPAGFCDAPTFTVSEAKRFREAEITHGRVSMLAALGWLVRVCFAHAAPNRCGAHVWAREQKRPLTRPRAAAPARARWLRSSTRSSAARLAARPSATSRRVAPCKPRRGAATETTGLRASRVHDSLR
jgi:hypothetical protein